MARTERQQFGSARAAQEAVAFEEVRQSFLARLHGEQAQLTILADELASSGRVPALVFGDLEVLAHRLRGAAAVFDSPALSEDAKSLELAAAASIASGRSDDPFVWATLRTLTARLAVMNGGQAPAAGLVLPAR